MKRISEETLDKWIEGVERKLGVVYGESGGTFEIVRTATEAVPQMVKELRRLYWEEEDKIIKNMLCPTCDTGTLDYDSNTGRFICYECGLPWSREALLEKKG